MYAATYNDELWVASQLHQTGARIACVAAMQPAHSNLACLCVHMRWVFVLRLPGGLMLSLQITTTLLGIGLAALILHLIRRDHLYVMHGLFWVLVAGAAAFLGTWPGLIDKLATLLGISYPPALLLLLASVVLLVKALHSDMVNTRIERDVRRLNQRLALLEANLDNPELPRPSQDIL